MLGSVPIYWDACFIFNVRKKNLTVKPYIWLSLLLRIAKDRRRDSKILKKNKNANYSTTKNVYIYRQGCRVLHRILGHNLRFFIFCFIVINVGIRICLKKNSLKYILFIILIIFMHFLRFFKNKYS